MFKSEFTIAPGQATNVRSGWAYATLNCGNNVYISYAPTNNCQIYSIGSACYIFVNRPKEDYIKILKHIQKNVLKNQVLIDISADHYCGVVESVFPKESMVFKQEYTNTKYSTKMCMYLFKTDWLTALIEQGRIKEESEKPKKEVELPF